MAIDWNGFYERGPASHLKSHSSSGAIALVYWHSSAYNRTLNWNGVHEKRPSHLKSHSRRSSSSSSLLLFIEHLTDACNRAFTRTGVHERGPSVGAGEHICSSLLPTARVAAPSLGIFYWYGVYQSGLVAAGEQLARVGNIHGRALALLFTRLSAAGGVGGRSGLDWNCHQLLLSL